MKRRESGALIAHYRCGCDTLPRMPVSQSCTLPGVAPRKPELRAVDLVAVDLGKDRATVFRWLRKGLLKRHYVHDLVAGRRKTAVDMHELRQLLEHPPADLDG
jgi:hypothetical protein